jgi:hypothetical protein
LCSCGSRSPVAGASAQIVETGGILLPNPQYEPDESNDHRFGVADYSLT